MYLGPYCSTCKLQDSLAPWNTWFLLQQIKASLSAAWFHLQDGWETHLYVGRNTVKCTQLFVSIWSFPVYVLFCSPEPAPKIFLRFNSLSIKQVWSQYPYLKYSTDCILPNRQTLLLISSLSLKLVSFWEKFILDNSRFHWKVLNLSGAETCTRFLLLRITACVFLAPRNQWSLQHHHDQCNDQHDQWNQWSLQQSNLSAWFSDMMLKKKKKATLKGSSIK